MGLERKIPALKDDLVVSKHDRSFQEQGHEVGTNRLFELRADERFIIREPEEKFVENNELKDPIAFANKSKMLFGELTEKYGIKCPIHFLVAKDETDTPKVFILTEKVKSVDYTSLATEEKQAAAKEIQAIFESLLNYYEDKEKQKTDFLWDVPQVDQFVYGKLPKDTENKWYLVDTDPYSARNVEKLFEAAETLDAEMYTLRKRFDLDVSSIEKRSERDDGQRGLIRGTPGLVRLIPCRISSETPRREAGRRSFRRPR